MVELKTIKDFETFEKDEPTIPFISIVELRKEAIKWIKFLEDEIEKYKYQEPPKEKGIGSMMVLATNLEKIHWIKDFFNLTEEDINEKKTN